MAIGHFDNNISTRENDTMLLSSWSGVRIFSYGVCILLLLALGIFVTEQMAGGSFALVILAILSGIGVIALIGIITGFLVRARSPVANFGSLVSLTSSTGFAVADSEGAIRFANDAYRDILCPDEADVIATPEQYFSGHREASEALYRLSESARQREPWSEDIRLITGDLDEPRWLRVSVRPVGETDDELTVWQVADISIDSMRQEDAFLELQQIINYLDHAPVGFFSLRPDGRIAYLNATLADWLGLSLDKTTGGAVAIEDIVSGASATLLRDYPATPGRVHVQMIDVDLTCTDSTSVPVRILHRVEFDDNGLARASRSVVLNRTRSEDVDDDLRAAEVRFARFFNNAPIGIATLDDTGSVLDANPAFSRIFAGQRATGGSVELVLDDDSREALLILLKRAGTGKTDLLPIDVSFGHGRTGQVFISRMEDARDEPTRLLTYVIDTTEQRSLEAQFAQSQKMQAIGQLAGGIAHDFNNVLTAIIGFSDLLLVNHRPTDPSFPDIMNIKQNANRAAGLVHQLLAFSRRQTLRPEVLSLTDVVSDFSVLLKRLLGETFELEVQHGRDLWLVKVDHNQFGQVLMNLVINARDAMDEGGTVLLRTSNVPAEVSVDMNKNLMPAADYVLIEVEDAGMGIAKENLEKIFEPFFTTKEVGKGTGLGLSTVYGIVKQTGGYISADSLGEGEGATFQIFLPRHIVRKDDIEPLKELRDPKPKSDLTGKETVLLVEDEDAVRVFAARALEARGYTVLPAQSGEQALKLVEEAGGGIDLVVSDVVMPEMDGPTLLKELRKKKYKFKMIFISGYAEEAFRKSLGDEEDFRFLPKPFTLKQLAQAVKDALDDE